MSLTDLHDDRLVEALERYACTRDEAERDHIIEATLWLAARGARRFAHRGEPFDDLLQVARIGLLKSVERFDPTRGVAFATYAMPTIVGELRRYFRDHTWSLHVPRTAKDVRPAVNTAADELAKELGRSPTTREIAERLDLTEDRVLEALEANSAYRTSELDPARVSTPMRGGDFQQVLDQQMLATLLQRLRPRERTILYLRFFEELSQAEIAERVGTSQVHVSRLIAASLATLRALLAQQDAGDAVPD